MKSLPTVVKGLPTVMKSLPAGSLSKKYQETVSNISVRTGFFKRPLKCLKIGQLHN